MSLSDLDDNTRSSRHRAALALHCLHTDDRRWLAARLTPEALAQVQPLLDELTSLGVVADPGLLQEILLAEPEMSATSPARCRIETATTRELWKLLRLEPPVLTGWLLACGPWPWEPEFRKKLDPNQLALAEQVAKRPVCAEATNALLEALAGRLRAGEEPRLQRAVRALALFRRRR